MNASVNTDRREAGEQIHSCESQKSGLPGKKKCEQACHYREAEDRRRIHATADTRKWSAGDRNKKRATRKKSNSEDTMTEECRKVVSSFFKERREKNPKGVRDAECQGT